MATSAWNQPPPVPSTTWPFLIRISACATGGLCAPASAAARSKSARAVVAKILLRCVILSPYGLLSATVHSLFRKTCGWQPCPLIMVAHIVADAALLQRAHTLRRFEKHAIERSP